MSARAVEQVERWASELIDLSKRNTSLNYKPNDPAAKRQSRTALGFVAPSPDRILQLVQVGKRLDVYLPPGNEEAFDPDGPSRPSSPQADMLVTDRRTAKDVEYTLRELSRRAEADRNDKGLHSLYLCFGMLVWREAEDAEWMRSPLVFAPVEIIRGSVREPYRLTRAEGDTVLNPSLRVLLERDFNVALPDIDPELSGTQGLLQALNATRAALHDPAWEVRDDVVLKRATFAKEAMYRDLLDNLEQVASHALIEALADPTSLPSDGEPEPPGEDRMDEIAPPERARLILDADGSQRRAVHAAVQGRSFVMDGPPGSGKSQTIANVIAELIAAGKSVLFVSEKVAALDVVAMRLRRHGLGDFLLDLHGNDVTRKQVAAELGRALRTHPIAHPRLGAAQLEQARRLRVALSAYASAVNIVREPLGRTVHWVLGRLAQLDDLPIAPRPAGIGETLTAAAAADLLDRFDELARVWAPVETPEHFHWLGLAGDPTGPAARDELQRQLASLQNGLNEVEELAGELAYAVGFAPPNHLSEAERVASVLDHCRHQPTTEPGWWSHPDLGAVESRVLELRSMSSRRQKAIEQLRAHYGERWLDLPTNGAEQLVGSLALLQSLRPALTGEHLARDRAALLIGFANATAELAAELPAESAYLAAALQAGERDRTVTEIIRLAAVGEQTDAVLRPEPRWASTLVAAQVEQALRTLQPLVNDYRRRRLALGEVFDDGVYDLDLQGLVTRFEQIHTGMGKLGSAYRADKRQVAAVARTRKASADVRGYLREALAVHHLGVAIDEQERASHELLGRFFSPRATDVDAATRALQLLKFAANELGADYNPAGVAAQLAGPGPADPRLAARSQHLRQRLERWHERSIDVLGADRGLTELTPAELVTWASTAREALTAGADVLAAAGELRDLPAGVEDILAELRMRADLAKGEAELAERAIEDAVLLGDRYTGFASPWEDLLTGIRWTIELQGRHGAPLGRAATARIHNSPAVPDPAPLAERLELVRKMIGQLSAQFEPARGTDLIEELGGRFSNAQDQVTLLADHLDQIEVWQAYTARSSGLRADGWSAALDFCVDRKMPAGELAEVLERAMYAAWYDMVSMGDPTLRGIRADELEAKVAQFRDLDRQVVRDAAEHVVQACVARKPTTTVGPARIIDHQAQLKSRHMPVRRLLEQTAEVVTALKPCFMMSPLSVSQFLPAGFAFDTVIFDEASQITPADAANCIYRGRQLIVAGDDRQLPPTSFFQSGGSDTDSDEYEEGQFDEFESVLKLAKGTAKLPSLPLRWHYRSKHESLITFSNYRFYDGNLITFPGAAESGADLGVELFVVDGIYQRGGARINLPEAQQAAERVMFHATRYPNNSLGVVAFSQPQADAIEDAVERLCEDYPDLEERLAGGRLDGFFVKNLESVQGDERDTMIFSVGYGPDEVGKLTAGFGPLNGESGWRRLNVAITRARRRVEVISSFRAPQLAALGSTNVGVLALQRYLDFAERGVAALAIDLSESGGDVESPLEASVCSVLRSWGLDVVPQVGTAGYRIDLGVRDPRRRGRYLLGVECDGAAYHSSKLARDRDRLRQEVLEGLGWKLHRVWGSSWYRDRPGQERRLRMALERALVDDGPVPVTPPTEPIVRTTIAADLNQAPDWAETYRTFRANINSFRNPAEPLERSRLSAVVASVVRTESPIHMELLGRRIGQLWDCNATKRVRTAIQYVLWDLQREGRCRITGDFIWTGAVPEKVPVRVPDPSDDRTRREIEHIAPEELQSAVRQLLIDARVAGEEELLVSVARLFGYERTGARIRSALDDCLHALIDDGMAVLGSDQLLRPR